MKGTVANIVGMYEKGRYTKQMDDASPMLPPPFFGRNGSTGDIPYHISLLPTKPPAQLLQRRYSYRIRKCMAGLRSVSFRRNNTMQGHSKDEQTEASSPSPSESLDDKDFTPSFQEPLFQEHGYASFQESTSYLEKVHAELDTWKDKEEYFGKLDESWKLDESEKNEPHEHPQTQSNDDAKANGNSNRSDVSLEPTPWHLADLHCLVDGSEEPRALSSKRLQVCNSNAEAIADQDSSFDKPNESPSSTPRTVRPSSSSTLGTNDLRPPRHRNRSRHSSSRHSGVKRTQKRRKSLGSLPRRQDLALASSTHGRSSFEKSERRQDFALASSTTHGRSSFEKSKGGKQPLDECGQAVLHEKKGALALKTSTNQRTKCGLRRIHSLEPSQTFPRSISRRSMEPNKINSKVLGRTLNDDTADAHLEILDENQEKAASCKHQGTEQATNRTYRNRPSTSVCHDRNHVATRGGRPALTRQKSSRRLPGGRREPKKTNSKILGSIFNDVTADAHLEIIDENQEKADSCERQGTEQAINRTYRKRPSTSVCHDRNHVTTRGGRPALTRQKSSRRLPGGRRRQLSTNSIPAQKSAYPIMR